MRRSLAIVDLEKSVIENAYKQMSRYRDLPMDLADATIVALGNSTGMRQLFTLDGDFRIYKLDDGTFFEIFP